ncbi:hypothetical protein D3C71_1769470 [compost metagenome]
MNAAVRAERKHIGGTGQPHPFAAVGGQLWRFDLEGHGDIAATAAFGDEITHALRKPVQGHQAPLVSDGLPREFGEAGVDGG